MPGAYKRLLQSPSETPEIFPGDDGNFHLFTATTKDIVETIVTPAVFFAYDIRHCHAIALWQVRNGPLPEVEED